jgi:hypothetical protein
VHACAAHIEHGKDKAKCFEVVHAENRMKNLAVKAMLENFPYLKVKDHLGQEHILPGISFSFDAQRTLQIGHKELKDEDKTALQAIVDKGLGDQRAKVK